MTKMNKLTDSGKGHSPNNVASYRLMAAEKNFELSIFDGIT